MGKKLKIAISGSSGKVGQILCSIAPEHGYEVVQTFSRTSIKSTKTLTPSCDVVVDFSHPELTLKVAKLCSETQTPLLVCTTGFNAGQMSQLKTLLAKTMWAYVPNTSLGVFALTQALIHVSKLVQPHFDEPVIIESHHKQKIDAPSGTAEMLKKTIETSTHKKLINKILSIRAGTDAGTHTVSWYGPFEEIHFTHKAQDRRVFAVGALEIAKQLTKIGKNQKGPCPLGLSDLYFLD